VSTDARKTGGSGGHTRACEAVIGERTDACQSGEGSDSTLLSKYRDVVKIQNIRGDEIDCHK